MNLVCGLHFWQFVKRNICIPFIRQHICVQSQFLDRLSILPLDTLICLMLCLVECKRTTYKIYMAGKEPISKACAITMTSQWAPWRLKSPVSRLFTQPFIRAQINENSKAPRHWQLWGKFTGTGEFPAQIASNADNFSIWWRHHGQYLRPVLFTTLTVYQQNGDYRTWATIVHDCGECNFAKYYFFIDGTRDITILWSLSISSKATNNRCTDFSLHTNAVW